MRISVITPTADQPVGMALCERFMARQTVKPDQWIVADDGLEPARLTMGQTHLVRHRQHDGARSLAGNILAALPEVTGDVVLIAEHDDAYAANHIEVCLEMLAHADAVGSRTQRYYNVATRQWCVMRNVGSSLCNTALRVSLLPYLRRAAETAFDHQMIGIDRLFWDSIGSMGQTHGIDTVVGIKGLPGRKGLGLGHRPDRRFTFDPDLAQLRAWIGDDADLYAEFVRG